MARDFYLERPVNERCGASRVAARNGDTWFVYCHLRAAHSGGHDFTAPRMAPPPDPAAMNRAAESQTPRPFRFTAPQPNVANGDGDLKGWTLLALIAIAVLVGVLAAGCFGWLS